MRKELHINDPDIKNLIKEILDRVTLLEAEGVQVQSQPLGFMRLALDGQKNNEEGHFLHLWAPHLPKQEGGPFIHTHVFDMKSRVLSGALKDIQYSAEVDKNGDSRLTSAECREEYCLPFNEQEQFFSMKIIQSKDLKAGEIYEVFKNNFHNTVVDINAITVTIMKKYNIENSDPVLSIPFTQSIPKEVFRRDQIDQQFAWRTIKETLASCL